MQLPNGSDSDDVPTLTNLQRCRPLPSSLLASFRWRISQSACALRYRWHPTGLSRLTMLKHRLSSVAAPVGIAAPAGGFNFRFSPPSSSRIAHGTNASDSHDEIDVRAMILGAHRAYVAVRLTHRCNSCRRLRRRRRCCC